MRATFISSEWFSAQFRETISWCRITWQPILPYALAFAAGAMIFVVIEEVIPEAQQSGHGDAATMGAILGFAVMMMLDVALG